ncbi:regulated by circadian rhythms/ conidium formation [Cryphonectria parasitica EP155]|uniref:Dynactin subunit 4 n=1 Tax=Cryphonectria parasitica (strain ATCC 38755 / EP155) TaxID=660469 RepID=A0A9P4YAP0_CRYP1|nr:regulated by circadian rhythms/ conidium formation [Cryphonectria parasitica EP155]KAF3769540.1 regulated by circadian rhythms/ conidium formation [Cryphonectria parasitica EP155]
MAAITPYTYIQCPCSDPANVSRHNHNDPTTPLQTETDDDERAFDPRAPRANYSLYPLEYLLYCEDCHQIRCPRCIAEEIVTYYCPNCLFEVPGSNIKSDGNRCTRSCFQCPVCVGPLAVTATDPPPPSASDPHAETAQSSAQPSYILTCSYCQWTSTEIGVRFDKPNGIYAQLQKIRNGGRTRLTPRERKDRRKDGTPGSSSPEHRDVETQFGSLKSFYQSQLADASSTGPSGLSSLGDLGIGSPGSLSRIMSLYTGTGLLGDKKGAKSRSHLMRESLEPDEGLQVADLDETASIERLHQSGWDGTASLDQAAAQLPVNVCEPVMHGRSKFLDELRPIPYLLRTKRSKRCPVCRHIVSKPEAKVSNTRFRIRLVAGSYIPTISMRPLQATSLSQTISGAPSGASISAAGPAALLAPLRPVQFLLTFKNPIFEAVKVTLATPSVTPGRFASKVTILCPEFEIDANTDVWDEALKDGDKDRRRRGGIEDAAGQQHQAEPGKVWERGRNWVTIVVEVVPASLRLEKTNFSILARDAKGAMDLRPLREDEDILEIPMYVRLEWETDDAAQDGAPAKDNKDGREKRELAYWCALGIGRIKQD